MNKIDQIKQGVLAPYGGLRGLGERMEQLTGGLEMRVAKGIETTADGKRLVFKAPKPYEKK